MRDLRRVMQQNDAAIVLFAITERRSRALFWKMAQATRNRSAPKHWEIFDCVGQEEVVEAAEHYFGGFLKGHFASRLDILNMLAANLSDTVGRGPLLKDLRRIYYEARTVGKKHPDSWVLKVLGQMPLFKNVF